MSLQCLGFGTQWPFVSSLPTGSWRPQEQNCFCGVGNGWNDVCPDVSIVTMVFAIESYVFIKSNVCHVFCNGVQAFCNDDWVPNFSSSLILAWVSCSATMCHQHFWRLANPKVFWRSSNILDFILTSDHMTRKETSSVSTPKDLVHLLLIFMVFQRRLLSEIATAITCCNRSFIRSECTLLSICQWFRTSNVSKNKCHSPQTQDDYCSLFHGISKALLLVAVKAVAERLTFSYLCWVTLPSDLDQAGKLRTIWGVTGSRWRWFIVARKGKLNVSFWSQSTGSRGVGHHSLAFTYK